MELLGLNWIGWIFALFSGIALLLGIAITWHQYANTELREAARKRVLDDLVLFSIWVLGLVGGIGVLLEKAWSRPTLEFFCWTLMVLLLMSSWSRLRAMPPPRHLRAIQAALFVIPILAICMATIVTLRSEHALRVLAG
jgi:predicted small integral membrane protein